MSLVGRCRTRDARREEDADAFRRCTGTYNPLEALPESAVVVVVVLICSRASDGK